MAAGFMKRPNTTTTTQDIRGFFGVNQRRGNVLSGTQDIRGFLISGGDYEERENGGEEGGRQGGIREGKGEKRLKGEGEGRTTLEYKNTNRDVCEERVHDKEGNDDTTRLEMLGNSAAAPDQASVARACPFYKRIKSTRFAVDSFDSAPETSIKHYFLSHYHADHYRGITSKWNNGTLWCTPVTRNLLLMNYPGLQNARVKTIAIGTSVVVDGVTVSALDANHCPGSCMFLFRDFRTGENHLHTGDFRASEEMYIHSRELCALRNRRIRTLHLDTTYCSPEYVFPAQKRVLLWVERAVATFVDAHPRALIVIGAYFIGKERVQLAVAKALGQKLFVDARRKKTMTLLDWQELEDTLTSDPRETCIHVVGMGKLREPELVAHKTKHCGSDRDVILSIRPTGWTFNAQTPLEKLAPTWSRSGAIASLGVPYSEHSSFVELQRFVRWLRPCDVLPHVNIGSLGNRTRQDRLIRGWIK